MIALFVSCASNNKNGIHLNDDQAIINDSGTDKTLLIHFKNEEEFKKYNNLKDSSPKKEEEPTVISSPDGNTLEVHT